MDVTQMSIADKRWKAVFTLRNLSQQQQLRELSAAASKVKFQETELFKVACKQLGDLHQLEYCSLPIHPLNLLVVYLLPKTRSTSQPSIFLVALTGSYSFLQRIGAIMRDGAKLFAVGTSASLVGTGITNALIKARKAFDKSFAGEAEDVPIISTSVAYGVYMAVSSNLRYQVLAGVIEQRILEPLLHQHKLIVSAICYAVRTGNTFLGSLIFCKTYS
ncbi:hypothetical protein Dsin_010937 [Dipteronia sinensis]|uniref:Uncharacterized protein n=1 Tax=Dipteronia sinensis TaxID=43782 RepID=A0AAE0EDJ6_9ROSI|nr:hypothetical protein Dsin_010937 [Dipteronia sinensis]